MQAAMKLRNCARAAPPNERSSINNYPAHISRDKTKPLYLYVAYCKGMAKIGLSDDTRRRVQGMQGGNPFPIELIYSVALPFDAAITAEKETMSALNAMHWFGDWFKTSRSHAKFIASGVAAKHQVPGVEYQQRAVRPANGKFPGLKRKVANADGRIFESCAAAAQFAGISRQAMYNRLKVRKDGWRYPDEGG
jgi:hypothetical protein